MTLYLHRHLQVFFTTLGDICRTPLMSFNSIIVIAITFFMPLFLYVGVNTVQNISGDWQGRPQLTLFLHNELDQAQGQLIYEEINLLPEIATAQYISSEQGLEEFKQLSNHQLDLTILDTNPIPASIVIMPDDEFLQPQRLEKLQQKLKKIQGIENIRFDLQWLKRFNSLLSLAQYIGFIVSGLLLFGMIFIVSNNIKLLILNRRKEIEISKLVGGSDTFVRRPFLYYGALFGLLGSIITLSMLSIVQLFLASPLNELAKLYFTQITLYSLSLLEYLIILFLGTFLGWLAARWSVAIHLFKIKPK